MVLYGLLYVRVRTMGQELRKIEQIYDTLAAEYAETFSGEHDRKPKDRGILHRFSQEIGNRRPVWDFGCGPGQTAQYLKNLGIEISGLDLSEKLLEQARARHPEIHFRKGDMLDLDFESDSIAGAVAFYAIIHFTEEQVGTAFREVFRVLQPGGLFLLTYHVGEGTLHVSEFIGKKVDIIVRFFTKDFISCCLKDCGFEQIETIEREPYPGVEYQSRRAYVFATKPVVQKSS
jgi:ubiquinone/menaquinone biosynthesis C-methylase UbiE